MGQFLTLSGWAPWIRLVKSNHFIHFFRCRDGDKVKSWFSRLSSANDIMHNPYTEFIGIFILVLGSIVLRVMRVAYSTHKIQINIFVFVVFRWEWIICQIINKYKIQSFQCIAHIRETNSRTLYPPYVVRALQYLALAGSLLEIYRWLVL